MNIRSLFQYSLLFLFFAAILGCGNNAGKDSVSSHRPYLQAASCAEICHNDAHGTITSDPDPLVTNGSGTAGKHIAHVTYAGIDCEKCHDGYGIQPTHMDGTLDTVNLVIFDPAANPGSWNKSAGPPLSGICTNATCHGIDQLDWYGTSVLNYTECTKCHAYPTQTRRPVVGAQGDFGGNSAVVSHHISGTSDPQNGQCTVCHDQTNHTQGTVRVKNADSGTGIDYSTAADLETFCLSCHDANGANGNMSPFVDGSTLGAAPYKAGVQISTQWNKNYGHRYKDNGLTCLGNGSPNTGCHLNGHGSGNKGMLALHMTLPLPDRFEENDFELCFVCHAAYPTAVSKEVVFGVRLGGNYDDAYGPFRQAGPATMTFNDAADTITRDAGSFLSDRFLVGNKVGISAAADSANRGPFLIADVTATTLTITTLAGGDPALVDGTETNLTVTTASPLYYIPAIQTKFRDQTCTALDQPYKDDNCNWWGYQKANLHWFHIGMQAWNYRDSIPSGLSCMSCHSVHGTDSMWGMTHDELGYQHNLGAGSDEYGTMSSQLPYTADQFPINCTFLCHDGTWWGTTSNWFEPSNE